MNFVDVAIPSPLRSTFTYKNNTGELLAGKRVLVEFGKRKLVGVVTTDKSDFKGQYKIKDILQVLDDKPTFNDIQLITIERISKHYMHPIGVCLLYTSPSPRDKRQSRMPSSA